MCLFNSFSFDGYHDTTVYQFLFSGYRYEYCEDIGIIHNSNFSDTSITCFGIFDISKNTKRSGIIERFSYKKRTF